MIGSVLSGYQIIDKVKDGSVGTVWRARTRRNQVVALKLISAKNAAVSRKLKQFKKEATLTKGLNHAGIIRVYEYVNHKQPFFTMEYFPSENLKWLTARLPRIINGSEFKILNQLAQSLAYVHAQGIIHKDIKPENVLVSKRGDTRLIDFSLAQTKMDRLLQFGKRVEGTPMYMAPEQIRGEKCGPATDIYAFGLLMFELLTKRPAFTGQSQTELFNRHLRQPAPSMRNVVKTISPDLDTLVQAMLIKKPDRRLKDMTAVIYELAKWDKKDTVIRNRQVRHVAPSVPTDVPVELASTVA